MRHSIEIPQKFEYNMHTCTTCNSCNWASTQCSTVTFVMNYGLIVASGETDSFTLFTCITRTPTLSDVIMVKIVVLCSNFYGIQVYNWAVQWVPYWQQHWLQSDRSHKQTFLQECSYHDLHMAVEASLLPDHLSKLHNILDPNDMIDGCLTGENGGHMPVTHTDTC